MTRLRYRHLQRLESQAGPIAVATDTSFVLADVKSYRSKSWDVSDPIPHYFMSSLKQFNYILSQKSKKGDLR